MQFPKSILLRNYTSFIVFLIVLLFFTSIGCQSMPEMQKPEPITSQGNYKTNCIVISIDTLRADHLGCYGYKEIKTPNIDALASEGALFSKAYTPVPVTLPSHCSIFTGLSPIGHGVRNNGTFRLHDEQTTLAEIFQELGYRTGAFIGAFVLDNRFGLNQGFEVYNDNLANGEEKSVFFYNERPAEKVIDSAINWIGQTDDRPFFAWIHCFDPHAPYAPPSPYLERYSNLPYDGEIVYIDDMMGKLFRFLKKKRLFDSTLICFTADHGEGLGEHEEKTHAIFIYDATLHVPLIFHLPGKVSSGLVIDKEVNLTDIFPTILSLIGIQYNNSVHGIPLFDNEMLDERKTELYCETFYPLYNHKWSPLEGIRTGDWKYIKAPRSELYNLSEDQKELNNLFGKNPQIVEKMEKLLNAKKQLLENTGVTKNARMKLDSDTREKLESLGYIWTSHMDMEEHMIGDYPDPKDMIGLLDYLNRGTYYYMVGEYDKAVTEFKKLLKLNPYDVFTHFVLGYIYDKKGWTDLAIQELEEAIRLDPGYINAYNNLGTIYNKTGHRDEAIKYFAKAIELNPSYIEAYDNIGVVYYLKKEYDTAVTYFTKAIELDPDYAKAYNNMGSILIARGQYKDAKDPISKAIELDPNFTDAFNNLGSAYLGLLELQEAKELFLKTLNFDPNHQEALINLATVNIELGEFDEAREVIDSVMKKNPNVAKIYNCMGTLLLKKGKPEEAVTQFKESLYLDPDSFETYYNLGIVYFMLGRIDDAIREYKRALNYNTKNAGVYVNLGIALFQKGLIDLAVSNYQQALEMDPHNVEAMINLGVAYYNLGLPDMAIEKYKTALNIKPDNVQALINLGIAFFSKGLIDEAIEQYLAVLEIDPEHMDARTNLGIAYFQQQKFQESIDQYMEIIKIDPQSYKAYYGISYCYFMLGSYNEAIHYLREAIRIKPDYTEAILLMERIEMMNALGIRL